MIIGKNLSKGIGGKMEITQRYDGLLGLVDRRKGEVFEFISFLEAETSWLISPASTRFHNDFEGGLLQHSISVAETLFKIKEILAPSIENESCVIVGLFHDVGKVGFPGKPYYLPNPDKEGGRKSGRRYIINPEVVSMGLAVRSLFLVSQYIPLTEEEAQAIAYHDGQYLPENKVIAHREEPLTLLLSYADNWTGSVLERKGYFGKTFPQEGKSENVEGF
jgi:hypothetical protein